MSDNKNSWAFILGGSSGFGLATAKLLATKKFNIFIVYRDSKANIKIVNKHFYEIKKNKIKFCSVNTNASTKQGQDKILLKIKEVLNKKGKIKVFLHSVADGNLKSLISKDINDTSNSSLSEEDLNYTTNSMGMSFVIWSKLLLRNNLFAENARIIGLTSEGSKNVFPYYAAVSLAKAILENSCRYLAVELAPFGIRTNLINAGITDTPALKAIPNYEKILKNTINKNPFKRLTRTEDIANVIYLLTTKEADWINGEIIRVDGGEQIVY